jgi:hypothetical protein
MATAAVPAMRRDLIPENDLRQSIAVTALDLSRIRKAQAILTQGGPIRFLDRAIPSTDAEREADWNHAVTVWTERVMWDRDFNLERFDENCYGYFEGIWLEDIKQRIAYLKWVDVGGELTSNASRQGFYFQACDELRKRLADPQYKQPHHGRAVQRLEALNHGVLRAALVSRKATRTGSQKSAETFVSEFYGNIVPAVEKQDRDATIRVVKALLNGGSAPGQPDLVNGFETVVTVAFLNPAVVRDCWRDHTQGITETATL